MAANTNRHTASVQHEDAGHFMMDVRRHPHTNAPMVHVCFPHDYLDVRSVEDLKKLLAHFGGHTAVWTHLLPNSKFARYTYVTKTRPALRYYCKKYGQPIPEWLKDESQFQKMSNADKMRYFGRTKLPNREFRKPPVQGLKPTKKQAPSPKES